jgi:hypothetical protein
MPDITAARPLSGASIESAWGGQVHDSIEGIQAGNDSTTTTGATSSSKAIVFPRPYTATPMILVSVGGGSSAYVGAVGSQTPTGFSFVGSRKDGANVGGGIPFYWLAIGTPA